MYLIVTGNKFIGSNEILDAGVDGGIITLAAMRI